MGATSVLLGSQVFASGAETFLSLQAQKSQQRWQQMISNENREMANLLAEDSIRRGKKRATQISKNARVLIGAQRAAFAAQGIDISEGTALAIQEETAAFAAEDALAIKNNAWREAWGFKTEALRETARGQLSELSSRTRQRATLLTGGLRLSEFGAQFLGSRR